MVQYARGSAPRRRSFGAAALVATVAAIITVVVATVITAVPAHAAGLTQVSTFGSNPGNLAMYSYRPDGLPAGRPLVVALHGCTQSANGYFTNSGWQKYADLWGFSLVFAEQRSANQSLSCFSWYVDGDITRGQGEALSIKQMVDYAVSTYGADPTRVYVTGLSAGGAMSAVMLATYPDVFAGGSIIGGVPYRCSPPASTSTCQYVGVDKTPQQWGDAVRAAYPGYAGRRPKVAIWHGTADYTVVVANSAESRDQWTNVHGVSTTPTSTRTLPANTTLETFGGDVVRRYTVSGMGHGTPVDPGPATEQCGSTAAYFLDTICSTYYDAVYFGLGQSTGPTPSPSATSTASPTPSPTTTASPVCVTANNYQHVQAGRAYHSLGYAYALGSNQNMGLYNTFVTHTLQQTGTNWWVIADGQC
ncbi:MAG TPA: PHB depolymerase family esterase [Micromonosporaceae bacterium]